MTPEEVVGVWRLASYTEVGEDGGTVAGPLGEAPAGLLIYTADGHVAVSMMKTGEAPALETYMGYSGQWRLAGDRMTHRVQVSAHPRMAGTEQIRRVTLDGETLSLRGTAVTPVGGRAPERVLTWRRARPDGIAGDRIAGDSTGSGSTASDNSGFDSTESDSTASDETAEQQEKETH
ncbi:lipocalin-like domain-containing protein [Streptomyces liliifuscus]|uniref:Lipocalin-like domain-containing protein n=1 Tax=Streptomyces liliifuscus TaxID=2797636 RepID=A0A7T7KZL7_9ACTN|nr:lipocalin-like domain-containing protein [Streptomyces liliifuscus]QQM43706.1 lipocalin-like domain-containing protein [Streptomyces liliifuscus]